MKSRFFTLGVFVLVFVLASSGNIQQSAEQLYQSGLYKEEVGGELEEAIKLYERIIKNFPENHPIAAKALFHVGLCYEKLGNKKAQKAYQRLIKEYPGQIQEVNLAKERLSRLVKFTETISHEPTFRKIRIPTKISPEMRLSPDGQKISLETERKLWIMPLSGKLGPDFPGEPAELNTEDVDVDFSAHAWSGDGKWIAFNEYLPLEVPLEEQSKENMGNQSIYVVSSEGGTPKKVYETYRDQRMINYRISLSPHGKTLAFSSVDVERNEQHIYTIPVDGGVPKKLVDIQAREPVFSPDGKMIAFVEDKKLGRESGGLWIVPAQGGTPKRVADAANASSPIWSPEGDMIAFIDEQDKVAQIHITPIVEDGGVSWEKITIDAPEGIKKVISLVGWSPDNKIAAIFVRPWEIGLYTLPAKGGKAVQIAHGGFPSQPRWSSDGTRIFHVNVANEGSGAWQRLGVATVPAGGGSVTTVPIQSDTEMRIWHFGAGNRISPDGKTIVFSGKIRKDQDSFPYRFLHYNIWTLPVEGGIPKQLTEAPEQATDMFPCWSPDGKAVAFVRARLSKNLVEGISNMNIYIVQANGGEPRQLTSESDHVNFSFIDWSPDGKLLAYFSGHPNSSDGTLNVIPADGGEPHVVWKLHSANPGKELAWSPDSKRIAFEGDEKEVIKVISLKDGSMVNIETDLEDTFIGHLHWSPDGKKFVFVGGHDGDSEFWLIEDFMPLVKGRE